MDSADTFDAEFDHMFLGGGADANSSPPPSPSPPPKPASLSLSPSLSPDLSCCSIGNPSTPLATLTPAAAPSSPSKQQSGCFAAMNAVHMELQENARLPTFNMTVDRSNATSGTAMGNSSTLLGAGLRIRTRGSSSGRGGAMPAASASRLGGIGGMSPSTSADIDEMLRLSENDVNLTELFLGESSRSSAAAAYSNAGALLGSIGTRIGDTSCKVASSADASAAAAASDLARGIPVGRGISHAVSAPKESTPSALRSSQSDQPDLYNVYPYGRPVPLPIPSASGSGGVGSNKAIDGASNAMIEGGASFEGGRTDSLPKENHAIADAVATAAAIARSQRSAKAAAKADAAARRRQASAKHLLDERVSTVPPDPATCSKGRNGNVALAAFLDVGSAVANGNAKDDKDKAKPVAPLVDTPGSSSAAPGAPPSVGRTGEAASPYPYTYPPTQPYPYHLPYRHHHHAATLAAAHSSTSASKTEATRKRSQFGFGNDHVVPSVPQPPPKKKTGQNKKRAAPSLGTDGGDSVGGNNGNGNGNCNTANAGPAYERKKQRAKDARIKLNDSIDRLDVAMTVAGNQSTERAARLRSMGMMAAHQQPNLTPSSSSSGPIRTFRPATINDMEDLAQAAAVAKKWDRPSFVGTAATVVEGLNLQCEALMREIVELEEAARLRGSINGGTTSGKDGSSLRPPAALLGSAISNGARTKTSSSIKGRVYMKGQSEKRLSKFGDENASSDVAVEEMGGFFGVLRCDGIFQIIQSCLDKKSLARCSCVSRSLHARFKETPKKES